MKIYPTDVYRVQVQTWPKGYTLDLEKISAKGSRKKSNSKRHCLVSTL